MGTSHSFLFRVTVASGNRLVWSGPGGTKIAWETKGD